MDNKANLYKLFQLTDLFIDKYQFNQIIIKQLNDIEKDEAWLANFDDKNYNLIRLTFNSAETFIYDKNHVDEFINYLSKTTNKKIKFLDIHINKEKYDPINEEYDYLNIDLNYADGKDVSKIYPELYKTIHEVKNGNDEIKNISKKLTGIVKGRINSRFKVSKDYCTYIIFGICSLIFFLSKYYTAKYSESAAYIFLGANYKTFTLGLKQFFRLITNGFVHAGFIHYFCNMYTLLSLGHYIESKFGHFKFILILFISILSGSLCEGILTDNGISLGLSSGLYGLMVVFIIDVISSKIININALMPVIFINIGINFISNTAYLAHIGGALGGYLVYKVIDSKEKTGPIILLSVFILALTFKYVTIDTINPIFSGTDYEVAKIFNDLGFKNYASKLIIRLVNVYSKYGG